MMIVPRCGAKHNCVMLPTPSSTATPSKDLHTILGANGVIGRELSRALATARQRVRQVSRHPQPVQAGDELRAADLLDASATADAVAGSAVVYLLVGLRYDTATWQAQWPRVMKNAIDACRRHGARLVFFDNVYAYGAVAGTMTETTAFNPCSRKGEVRAKVARALLDAMARGEVQALIARSADFYGPGAINSLVHATVFERLHAGQAPQWIGEPSAFHSFTYTPDAAGALAVLGQAHSAWGQTWHLPTSASAMSGEQMTRLACAQAQQPYRLRVMPRWLLKPAGWCVPALRENHELMYQLDRDYRFSSEKIEKALCLSATVYTQGVAATWASSG
jgi:nucleoside-diphosphate-sugar epimerase